MNYGNMSEENSNICIAQKNKNYYNGIVKEIEIGRFYWGTKTFNLLFLKGGRYYEEEIIFCIA